jgi:hypothetical protein
MIKPEELGRFSPYRLLPPGMIYKTESHKSSMSTRDRYNSNTGSQMKKTTRFHTHDEYTVMRDQLRPLIVPKVLSNGKLSKSVRKPVSIQLFNKGTQAGGVFIEKGIKVSTVTTVAELIIYILLIQKSSKPPGNVDASQQKVDEHLEKKIAIIKQLTKYWRCEVGFQPINDHMAIAILLLKIT